MDQTGIAAIARRTVAAVALLSVSLVVLGGVGHLLVFESRIGDAEGDVVQWLADHRSGVVDRMAEAGSALTDTWTVLGVLLGAATVLIATDRIRLAVAFVLAMVIEITVFLVVGAVVDRPRPAAEALDSVPSTPSFPSGHVAAAVIVYGFLALILRTVGARRAPATIWLFPVVAVLAVGAARLYEGVHYPSDVVAGALLGIGSFAAGIHVAGIGPSAGSDGDGFASREIQGDVDRPTDEADVGATT